VTQNHNNLGPVDVGPARRSLVHSRVMFALAATAALAASVTEADARAREISASSYGFADSLLTNNSLERPPALSPFAGVERQGCAVNCGPAFGTFVVRRSELLTSNTADVSVRKTGDAAGHQMGVSGMNVVERLVSDSSGLTSWVVVSERIVDETSSRSWSLLSGVPLAAPWLPGDLYRFEGSSLSIDILSDAPPTPEASTWVMMLIGFAGLGFAGYRNSGNGKFSLLMRKGAHG
jgi:hypothetical protein